MHELAREGIEIDRDPRAVTVHRFDVSPTADPKVLACEVHCSSGTYVRTLAADLGTLLGGGAHLRNLRRSAVGSFTEAEAHGLEDLQLLDAAEAMRDDERVTVPDDTAALVRNGRALDRFEGEGPWAVCDERGDLLAMYEAQGERAKPAVVLAPHGAG